MEADDDYPVVEGLSDETRQFSRSVCVIPVAIVPPESGGGVAPRTVADNISREAMRTRISRSRPLLDVFRNRARPHSRSSGLPG